MGLKGHHYLPDLRAESSLLFMQAAFQERGGEEAFNIHAEQGVNTIGFNPSRGGHMVVPPMWAQGPACPQDPAHLKAHTYLAQLPGKAAHG